MLRLSTNLISSPEYGKRAKAIRKEAGLRKLEIKTSNRYRKRKKGKEYLKDT
jgi:hypothetical protein